MSLAPHPSSRFQIRTHPLLRLTLTSERRVVDLEGSSGVEVQVGRRLVSHPDENDISSDKVLCRDGRELSVTHDRACRGDEGEEGGEDGFGFGDLVVLDTGVEEGDTDEDSSDVLVGLIVDEVDSKEDVLEDTGEYEEAVSTWGQHRIGREREGGILTD